MRPSPARGIPAPDLTPPPPPPPARPLAARRPLLPGLEVMRVGVTLVIAFFHVWTGGLTRFLGLGDSVGVMAVVGPSMTGFFFVLSGFVLTYAYVDERGKMVVAPRTFWRARAARLLPLALLGHLLTAPLLLTGSSHYAAGEAVGRALLVLTALQAWVPPLADSYNVPAWSVSALVAFYAAFPGIVSATRGARHPRLRGALLATWAAALVPTTATYLAHARGWLPISLDAAERALHVLPLFRVAEFVSGIVLARLFMRPRARLPRSAGIAGVAVVIALLAGAATRLPSRLIANGALLPLWWIAIWGAATLPSALSAALLRLGARRVGRATLGVFLLHAPVLSWLNVAIFRGWFGRGTGLAIVLYLLALVPLGLAVERLFVAPIARWLLRQPPASLVRGEEPVPAA